MAEKKQRALKVLVAKKEHLFSSIQGLYDVGKQLSNAANRSKFIAGIALLDDTRKKFESVLEQINAISLELDEGYEPEFRALQAFDDIYCQILVISKEANTNPEKDKSRVEELNTNAPRLPKLNLPVFDGNMNDWPTFYECFKSMIHDKSQLSDIDKITYLIGSLSGSARSVCTGVHPVGNNYSILWEALVDKYQNDRLLANNYLEQMLNFKTASVPSSDFFNSFLEKFDCAYNALRKLSIDDLFDFVISYVALQKFDPDTRSLFENAHKEKSIPIYQDVLDFIKTQNKINSICSASLRKPNAGNPKRLAAQSFVAQDVLCTICRAPHAITKCNEFLKLTPFNRHKVAKEKQLCFNCLKPHRIKNCLSKYSCSICQHKHHTLLHFDRNPASVATDKSNVSNLAGPSVDLPVSETNSQNLSLCSSAFKKDNTVLLSTAVAYVIDHCGMKHRVRFLLDSGSTIHMLTVECAMRLKLKIQRCQSCITGIGIYDAKVKGKSSLVINSRFDESINYCLDVLLLDKIAENLPSYNCDQRSFSYLNDLPLADDTFSQAGKIDGIIGAELFAVMLRSGKVISGANRPIALETSLGYVVMGTVPTFSDFDSPQSSFFAAVDHSLEDLVSKFWELEEVPAQHFDSPSDAECEELYKSTVERDLSGRYIVSLPFNKHPSLLGNSYSNALRRFYFLERKFQKYPDLKTHYCEVIREYLREGYISEILDDSISQPSYIIPHHAIYKPDSSSTPVRIVLDASAKTDTSLSLNDILHIGPKLQSDVVTIFINFRLFQIAFTADIKKMYLQILMSEPHRRFQRLLWRFSADEPIKLYECNTVAFGVRSSPFLALRTVKQLAHDEKDKFPLAASFASRDFYMDDFVSSVDNVADAKFVYHQMVELFKAGKFDLGKWAVNSEQLLHEIPISDRSPKVVDFGDTLKVLGLQWHPDVDVFSFSINTESHKFTKRSVLSVLARLFDPLGFLSPVTLRIKLLIRELWKLQLDWDESPPLVLINTWKEFEGELFRLKDFKVPRHLGMCETGVATLVGFADACHTSYGAVIYLKTVESNNMTTVNFVCAKTKVAPMKVQTIPRLELCAAHLLARLLKFVRDTLSLRVRVQECYAFSDSTVTLHWIKSPPYKWQTFVANRVSQIQSLIDPSAWFHIDGKRNISDCLSRGLSPTMLLENRDWISGPEWLSLPFDEWPISSIIPDESFIPEEKATCLLAAVPEESIIYSLIERCSSWTRLLHITVYVLRFARILKSSGEINIEDLDTAELTLIAAVQKRYFMSDILMLRQGQLCSSRLRSLCPFLDGGVVRVGGRLENASVGYDARHPFLLPKKDHFVNLLIDNCHRKNLHTGPHLVTAILRQKYWILAARNVVRFRLRQCNLCFKIRPTSSFPIMGNLPTPRVTEAKPFTHAGVDYAGPFHITWSRRRGAKSQKAYLCLFICLCTKALHLELVSDLTTDMFLAAFKRFLSRRGPCSVMYSDCGTNFIGARNKLNEIYKLVDSREYTSGLKVGLEEYHLQWKFQPPGSPHFSGIWEANIKSVKSHLYKLIGSQILTYEEFHTVLVQIEALLNSRPLCWMSSDPSDPLPLTPAHFLTFSPLQVLPSSVEVEENPNLLTRKQLLDQMVHVFWKRWHVEYLNQLQIRQKWNTPGCPVQIGTVVVIRHDNLPPLRWPVGIITEIFPGADGVTRVAMVKTKDGLYKRPVVRLCPLPSQ